MIPPVAVSRRTLFGAGAAVPAATLLAACTGGGEASPDSAEPVNLTVLNGFEIQPWDAFLNLAQVGGYFEAENLNVTIRAGLGTGRNLAALASGEAQFAQLDTMAAITEFSKTVIGFDYQARDETDNGWNNFSLVSLLHHDLMASLVFLASSGIERPRDLHGKKVAVIPGGGPFTLFPALGLEANMDASQVELVVADGGLFNSMLASGQVDATVSFIGEVAAIEAEIGQPIGVIRYADWISDSLGSSMGCLRTYADENAEVVRRFNRACLHGLQDAATNPQEAGRVWWSRNQDLPGWNEELAVASCELVADYIQAEPNRPLGYLSAERLQAAISLLIGMGQAHETVEPPDIARFDLIDADR